MVAKVAILDIIANIRMAPLRAMGSRINIMIIRSGDGSLGSRIDK